MKKTRNDTPSTGYDVSGRSKLRSAVPRKAPAEPEEKKPPTAPGDVRVEKGEVYEFTYSCEDCGLVMKVNDVSYYQRICGKCNRKLTVTREKQG